jgi:hypothetical protein
MKRFTKEEMHAAWKQAGDQQREEQATAEKALEWVKRRCKFSGGRLTQPYGWATIGPDPTPYHLTFIYETYGPTLHSYIEVLEKATFARKTTGLGPEPFYEVETPLGTFTITFEYFDNHCCGY